MSSLTLTKEQLNDLYRAMPCNTSGGGYYKSPFCGEFEIENEPCRGSVKTPFVGEGGIFDPPSKSSVKRVACFTWDEYQSFDSEEEFNKEFDKRAVEVNHNEADLSLNETS